MSPDARASVRSWFSAKHPDMRTHKLITKSGAILDVLTEISRLWYWYYDGIGFHATAWVKMKENYYNSGRSTSIGRKSTTKPPEKCASKTVHSPFPSMCVGSLLRSSLRLCGDFIPHSNHIVTNWRNPHPSINNINRYTTIFIWMVFVLVSSIVEISWKYT